MSDPKSPVQSQGPPMNGENSKSTTPSNPSAILNSGQSDPPDRQSDPNGDFSKPLIPGEPGYTSHPPADPLSIGTENRDSASALIPATLNLQMAMVLVF